MSSAATELAKPPAAVREKGKGYVTGSYWRKRKDLIYYHYFHFMIRCIGVEAKSIIDVGSGNAPISTGSTGSPRRCRWTSSPYSSDQVRGIAGNIHDLKFDKRFDICTCMQVLEHVPEAGAFARRLMELGKVVVASVPYQWPENANKHHVHDPVDLKKVVRWFGREPNYHLVVREPFARKNGARLFTIFDVENPDKPYGNEILAAAARAATRASDPGARRKRTRHPGDAAPSPGEVRAAWKGLRTSSRSHPPGWTAPPLRSAAGPHVSAPALPAVPR